MKITIERAGNGFIIDSEERDEWKPDATLPWVVTSGDMGDDTDEIISLLYAIRELFDVNAKIDIRRLEPDKPLEDEEVSYVFPVKKRGRKRGNN